MRFLSVKFFILAHLFQKLCKILVLNSGSVSIYSYLYFLWGFASGLRLLSPLALCRGHVDTFVVKMLHLRQVKAPRVIHSLTPTH